MTEVQPNDVLCGRGGATNNHSGNRNFRKLVADHQQAYLMARKRDKRDIAQTIVSIIRNNGGRFLKRDETSTDEKWVDVGDKKACEKTSQALREGLEVRRNGFMDRGDPSLGNAKNIKAGAKPNPPKKKRKATPPITPLSLSPHNLPNMPPKNVVPIPHQLPPQLPPQMLSQRIPQPLPQSLPQKAGLPTEAKNDTGSTPMNYDAKTTTSVVPV